MKRLIALVCFLLLTGTAYAAFDYSPYMLEGYYPPMGVTLLQDGSAAASAWEYQDGSGETYFTWWKDGAMIRTHLLPHELYGFSLLERSGGKLVLLGSAINEDTRNAAVTLSICSYCTVDASGFGPLVEVTDAAIGMPREGDGCFALFELRDGQAWLNLYEGTPEWSWSIPMDVKQPAILYLSRVCRDGDRWLIVYNPNGGIRNKADYRLMCVQQGTVLYDRSLPGSGAVLGDGEGGYYLACSTGSGSYKPIVLQHYSADGRELARKTLDTNKLVLGCRMQLDPETGLVHLYGTAVANSRKVYTAWHLVCSTELEPLTDFDVRDCSYHGDYSPRLLIDASSRCHIFLQSMDDTEAPPVLVPFDALPVIKNPGIGVK